MTYQEFRELFYQILYPLYSANEIRAQFHWYIKEVFDIEPHLFYLNPNHVLPFEPKNQNDLEHLSTGEPIQYILGFSDFYGLRLAVNSSVLIPRPETEELVDNLLKEYSGFLSQNSQILDIGTGSGAIALALAKNLPNAHVTAVDFSEKAIDVAKMNAEQLAVSVNFIKWNILEEALPTSWNNHFNLIVSNPPYIPEKEIMELHPNVRNFEPGSALFVPDAQPLLFYEKIASIGQKILITGGLLALEIHSPFSKDINTLFQNYDYQDIKIKNDIQGKPRMFFCKKKIAK